MPRYFVFSYAPASCPTKKVRMTMEGAPVKAVPDAVRNGLVPRSAPFKAALECVRKWAPHAPEGTPQQGWQTWPGPPSAPPSEMAVLADRSRRKPAMAVECTGTRSHQDHGDLSWDPQIGTLLGGDGGIF